MDGLASAFRSKGTAKAEDKTEVREIKGGSTGVRLEASVGEHEEVVDFMTASLGEWLKEAHGGGYCGA